MKSGTPGRDGVDGQPLSIDGHEYEEAELVPPFLNEPDPGCRDYLPGVA